MSSNSYEAFAALAKKAIPEAAVLSREAMHTQIFNFLDEAAWWKTSIAGPERGIRDHLIMRFCPSQRDVGRVAAALRRAF
jgi:hypothetical protein